MENLQQAHNTDHVPADFLVRGGAAAIDAIILGVAQTILRLLFSLIHLPDFITKIVLIALGAGYFTYMLAMQEGQTIGKKAAGIAVIRTSGDPIELGRSFGRYLGTLLSGAILGIGYLIALFTPLKKALHDYIVDTRVVYVAEITKTRKIVLSCLGLLIPLFAILGLGAAILRP